MLIRAERATGVTGKEKEVLFIHWEKKGKERSTGAESLQETEGDRRGMNQEKRKHEGAVRGVVKENGGGKKTKSKGGQVTCPNACTKEKRKGQGLGLCGAEVAENRYSLGGENGGTFTLR